MERGPSYSLYLCCGHPGSHLGDTDEKARVIDVTPASSAVDDVVAALAAAQLNPSDFRSRAALVVDPATQSVEKVLALYAALCGLAARRLDVLVVSTESSPDAEPFRVVRATKVHDAALLLVAEQKPAAPSLLLVTGVSAPAGLPFVSLAHQPSPSELSLLRFTKRVLLSAASDLVTTLTHFVVVSALRRRGTNDRFPALVTGDPENALDLDEYRRRGLEIRQIVRPTTTGAVVPTLERTPRQLRLLEAARVDVEETLVRLGVTHDEDHEFWHCPRPERHSNADANPSMRVLPPTSSGEPALTRCYRCDAEPVDSLRLVMDTLGRTADEAADWLLDAPATSNR